MNQLENLFGLHRFSGSGFNIPPCFTNKEEMMVKDMLWNIIRCCNCHHSACYSDSKKCMAESESTEEVWCIKERFCKDFYLKFLKAKYTPVLHVGNYISLIICKLRKDPKQSHTFISTFTNSYLDCLRAVIGRLIDLLIEFSQCVNKIRQNIDSWLIWQFL